MPVSPKPRCRVCGRIGCTVHVRERGTSARSRGFEGEARTARDRLMRQHLEQYGWWCPGAADLRHVAHYVRAGQLDVDHVNGDAADNAPANLRVLCRHVNRGAARRDGGRQT